MYNNVINAILSGRKVFMEVENSRRLNQALKTKVLPQITVYDRGDYVYYKKEGTDSMWDGPAQVIGMSSNGKTIHIAHGRFTYSCSQARLSKIPKDKIKEIGPVTSHPMADSDSDDKPETPRAPVIPNLAPSHAPVPTPAPAQVPAPAHDPDDHQAPGDYDAPASPNPQEAQDELPVTPPLPLQAQARSPTTQFSFINPDINSEHDIPNTVTHQFQREEEGREMAKKSNPKKKGAKLPYPKKNQTIFFRIKNTVAYNKIHPNLVEKYGNKWVKVQILTRVYANSQNSGPYFNFKDCADENYLGGVHLDQTDWAFSTERPLPRTLADSIHNYMVEDDPQTLDSYIVHISRRAAL